MPILRWNDDKPHRCPFCYTVAVSTERPRSLSTYTCCKCGTLFTRWPLLALLTRNAGIRCQEHGPK